MTPIGAYVSVLDAITKYTMDNTNSTETGSIVRTLASLIQKVETWDVSYQLDKLPAWIAYAEEKIAEKNREVQHAKLQLKKVVMTEMLKSQRKNATEKKAEAELLAIGEEADFITKMADKEMLEVKHNYLTNKFISARKQTSLLERQLT